MDYLAVKDLKKTAELWRLLQSQKELVITRDGKPCAVMIGVTPEAVEETVREIRRSLLALAVRQAREAAQGDPRAQQDVDAAVTEVRQARRGA